MITTHILQLCTIMLYGLAGLCVFLILLNRFLIHIPDSRAKICATILAFLTITGGSMICGLLFYRTLWFFCPLAVLCLILMGEARRIFIRNSCAGSMPVGSKPHDTDLANPLTTTDVTIHRYEVRLPHWNGERLRIVHLTDLHVRSGLNAEYYNQVFELAEQTQPDLAVFTGDFVSRLDALPELREVLRPIGRVETFAVLGNHDYWVDAESVGRALKDSGLRLLSNESAIVTIKGREVVVTGYDYPWGKTEASNIPSSNGAIHLALSHTPDNIYRLSDSRMDIVFSGHYHAGQIRLPFLGSIVIPSVYGRRFDHGHFVVNGTHLFVPSGIGASNPPLRIYCRPDIFVVDILGETETNRYESGSSSI